MATNKPLTLLAEPYESVRSGYMRMDPRKDRLEDIRGP